MVKIQKCIYDMHAYDFTLIRPEFIQTKEPELAG